LGLGGGLEEKYSPISKDWSCSRMEMRLEGKKQRERQRQ